MATNLPQLRVLLVDDEPSILDVMGQFLGELGVGGIETAADGKQALRLLDRGGPAPDIILCDLNMPGMDGIEFIRHLGERTIRTGIILVSGEDSRVLSAVKALARSHGLYVLGVIPKPVALDTLKRLLRAYDSSKGFEPRHDAQPITEAELVQGLDDDLLFVVFQPKVDIAQGSVSGVEALARWAHAERGTLGPAAFVPLAEESGRIRALTERVFQKALAQGAKWRAAGLDLSVSVNFTTEDMERLDLPDYVVSCAQAAGMPPSKIILEVTEGRIMRNLKASLEILSRLRLKGIGLSIDDFGTGYSSMEQLQRAPFTEIKVDRTFVSGSVNDRTARTILESSITLGRNLNMSIVAEGAETRPEWDLLANLGCDLVQGYFVSPPLPADDVAGWVRRWRAPEIH